MMEFLCEFRSRIDGGMIVPVGLMRFAKGKKHKKLCVGWHVHFVVSSRLSMLFLAEYNLEGMPTSRLYNFRKYAPVCLTYASSQSQHMQILPRRFFDGFEQNDQFDFDGIAKYEVKLQFVKDAPRGFF
ncbi:hypothetical protein Tco_0929950 [Tanacetum coccineum]